MIFAATTGLIDKVPVSKVREFEKDFTTLLQATQRPTLDALRAGKLDNDVTDVLKKAASDVASKYA